MSTDENKAGETAGASSPWVAMAAEIRWCVVGTGFARVVDAATKLAAQYTGLLTATPFYKGATAPHVVELESRDETPPKPTELPAALGSRAKGNSVSAPRYGGMAAGSVVAGCDCNVLYLFSQLSHVGSVCYRHGCVRIEIARGCRASVRCRR